MKHRIEDLPDAFCGPQKGGVDVLIVAGEHSGDEHAAKMVAGLLEKNPNVSVYALGGKNLKSVGAHLLWDMTTSSVVGLVEVLKNYNYFKQLMHLTIAWIECYKPKVVCFVDYPGFNLRLAKILYKKGYAKKAGGDMHLVYYIGPQIWAWKAQRRFDMARYLDSLAVIFPFEVECYKDVSLPVQFVGHPFVDKEYALKLGYNSQAPILLLPGSREAAVRRILPLMMEAFSLYAQEDPEVKGVIIVPTDMIEKIVVDILNQWPFLKHKVTIRRNYEAIFGRAVIVSSGTMSLACALAEIPGIIVYKANCLTWFLGKLLVSIEYLGIMNILLKEPVYPEYLQSLAKPRLLVRGLKQLMEPASIVKARETARRLRTLLMAPSALNASEWLGRYVE